MDQTTITNIISLVDARITTNLTYIDSYDPSSQAAGVAQKTAENMALLNLKGAMLAVATARRSG